MGVGLGRRRQASLYSSFSSLLRPASSSAADGGVAPGLWRRWASIRGAVPRGGVGASGPAGHPFGPSVWAFVAPGLWLRWRATLRDALRLAGWSRSLENAGGFTNHGVLGRGVRGFELRRVGAAPGLRGPRIFSCFVGPRSFVVLVLQACFWLAGRAFMAEQRECCAWENTFVSASSM